MSRKATQEKIRRKSLKQHAIDTMMKKNKEAKMPEEEKIELDIHTLRSGIKNVQYDMIQHGDNPVFRNKIANMEQQLKNKIQELEILRNTPVDTKPEVGSSADDVLSAQSVGESVKTKTTGDSNLEVKNDNKEGKK